MIEQMKKSDCSASIMTSADSEEQDQETCQSSKKFRFNKKKPTTYCIICSKSKCKNDTKLYGISEQHNAKNLMSAARFFKNDVQTRFILWKTSGDIFAANVMYHKNCLGGYVLKFKQEVELIMRDSDDIEDECTETVISHVLMSVDLTTSAYHLSDLCKEVTKQLFLRKIGESILHDSVGCIVAKTLSCFLTHSKRFPNSPCIMTALLK